MMRFLRNLFSQTGAKGQRKPSLRKQQPLRQPKEPRSGWFKPRQAQSVAVALPKRLKQSEIDPILHQRRRQAVFAPLRRWGAHLRKAIGSPRLISAGIVTLCLLIMGQIVRGDHFYISAATVTIEGTALLSAEKLLQEVDLLGKHIFLLKPDELSEKLSALPHITDNRVEVRWPSDVLITLEENTPQLILEERGKLYWVMKDGFLLANIPTSQNNDNDLQLPLLRTEERLPTVERQEIEERMVQRPNEGWWKFWSKSSGLEKQSYTIQQRYLSAEWLSSIKQLQTLRSYTTEMVYESKGGLGFYDETGVLIYIGLGDRSTMNRKLAIYQAIKERLQKDGIKPTSINVSNESKPFYHAPQLAAQEQ